jgi:hypothetical protein
MVATTITDNSKPVNSNKCNGSGGRQLSCSLEVAQVRRNRDISMLLPIRWERYLVTVVSAYSARTPRHNTASDWLNASLLYVQAKLHWSYCLHAFDHFVLLILQDGRQLL